MANNNSFLNKIKGKGLMLTAEQIIAKKVNNSNPFAIVVGYIISRTEINPKGDIKRREIVNALTINSTTISEYLRQLVNAKFLYQPYTGIYRAVIRGRKPKILSLNSIVEDKLGI